MGRCCPAGNGAVGQDPGFKRNDQKKRDLGNVGVCLFNIEFWLFNIVVSYLIESEKYLLKVADLVFPLRGA